MSDYCRKKVVRCKVSPEQLGIEDLWGLEEKYRELLGIEIPSIESLRF